MKNASLKETIKQISTQKQKLLRKHNKEEHKKRVRDYQEKTNYKASPEKQKEYNRITYLRRKERLKKEQETNEKHLVILIY